MSVIRVPPAVRTTQIVLFGFTALVWLRGLMAIVVLLLAGDEEPGYVIGYYGVGMMFSVLPAVAGFLAARPGGWRYAAALVAAFGICFTGLASLAGNPLLGLLYGVIGVTAVVFAFISTRFYVGRGRGSPAPHTPYGGFAPGAWPAYGSAPDNPWLPQQQAHQLYGQQPYAQQQPQLHPDHVQHPQQYPQQWPHPQQPAPGAPPPQQWPHPSQGVPEFRPPQAPPDGRPPGS